MFARRAAAALAAIAVVAAGCSGTTNHDLVADGSTSTTAVAPSTSTSAPSAAATTTTTTASTAAPTTTTGAAAVTPPALVWTTCQNGFECATINPPLDWDHPDGRTVRLSVIRLKASGPVAQRIGSLFVNPGGPGASAIDFARQAPAFLPASVRARFDVVAFDPRGVGHSQAVNCGDGAYLDRYLHIDPTPDTPAEHQALVDASRQFAEACAADTGALLGHVDTRSAARDMDYLRAALGDSKLTYLGYSYGTFLGAMYADLFPQRVRALLLDGAVDPALSVEDTNRQQAAGFERAFNAFLTSCGVDTSCALRPDGDPHTVFDRLDSTVETKPLAVGGRSVGPAELYLAVASGLYSKAQWPQLASALHAGLGGNGAPLLAMMDAYTERRPDGTYGSLVVANTAVNCIDRPSPTDVAVYDADAASFVAQSPEFGAALAYGGLPCAFWKVPAVDTARPLRAAGAPPIVVIGTTNDPATPYTWAQSLASELESGVLVTNVGEGHTSFGSSKPCIIDAVDGYLLDLTVPKKGTTC